MTDLASNLDQTIGFAEKHYWRTEKLRRYIEAVSTALGVGLESSTVDAHVPASAYIALDGELARFPNRDVALLWDEHDGWAAAIEDGHGDSLLILRYLGGEAMPEPESVVRFVDSVRSENRSVS